MTLFPDYTSRRFLIVDDETFMLGLLERLLKLSKSGLIAKASDGRSALRAMKDESSRFDCVITDFDMKPLNGLQLLAAIRLGVNPTIPREQRVIMLTGNPDALVMAAAQALDVSAYIAKPVTPEKLFPVIDQVLNGLVQVQPVDAYRTVKLPQSTLTV